MTKIIITTVVTGMLVGYFIVSGSVAAYADTIISVGLCGLLLMVGIDIGNQGSVWSMIKKSGASLLVVPVMTIIGTLLGTITTGMFMGMSWNDAAAIGAGFGWYSLSPMLIAEYSAQLSAVAFMSNVMRELFSVILIPIVASKIGYLESVCLGGAASMDVLLPVVEKSTNGRIAIYSFVSGAVLSMVVPVLVSMLITM